MTNEKNHKKESFDTRRQRNDLEKLRVLLLLAALLPDNVDDCLAQLRNYDEGMVHHCCQTNNWGVLTKERSIRLSLQLFYKEEVLQTHKSTIILRFYAIVIFSIFVVILVSWLLFRFSFIVTLEIVTAIFFIELIVVIIYIGVYVRGIHKKLTSVGEHATLLSICRAQHSYNKDDGEHMKASREAAEKFEAFLLIAANLNFQRDWRNSTTDQGFTQEHLDVDNQDSNTTVYRGEENEVEQLYCSEDEESKDTTDQGFTQEHLDVHNQEGSSTIDGEENEAEQLDTIIIIGISEDEEAETKEF